MSLVLSFLSELGLYLSEQADHQIQEIRGKAFNFGEIHCSIFACIVFEICGKGEEAEVVRFEY